nr:protein translocase subunit SecF [Bacillus sp. NTK071]
MSSKVRDIKFDFVKHRNKFFAISLVLIVLGGLAIAIFGLNLGIDFSSGSRVDIQSDSTLTTEEVTKELEGLGLEPESVTLAGGGEMAVAAFKDELNKDEVAEIKNQFTDLYEIEPSVSTVSPDVAVDLAKNAFIAVAIASVGIILYVALRFEWLQGFAAIVALFHDAFFIIAVFSILQIEVNITFIAAVLTIVGYSINDTIVTFDRIRENMKFEKKMKTFDDVARVVNKSLVQTLARSINTVLTVVFAALALTIFGGEAIRPFAVALLIGLIAGTYSSIFIASQLWAVWKGKQLKKKKFAPAESEI